MNGGVGYFIGGLVTFMLCVGVLTYMAVSDDHDLDGEDALLYGVAAMMGCFAWPAVLIVGPAYLLAKHNNARKKAAK